MKQNFYDFKAISLRGEEIGMETYKGKVVLVVNTASKCGFTPQYAGLEKLYRQYKDCGLVILGFPCNQFGKQEPSSEQEIAGGCLLHYGVSFQMFSKIKVNGKDAHPLYKYLKSELKGTFGNAVKWNFTKFVIDRKGKSVMRFSSIVTPEKIEGEIENLL